MLACSHFEAKRPFHWREWIAVIVCASLCSCGGNSSSATNSPPPPPPPPQMLSRSDVSAIVQAAAQAVSSDTMVIAVVDRLGRVLAVYTEPSAPTMVVGNFNKMVSSDDLAVSLARTGAFFSNNKAPLSSRTVRFISGTHFPPEVMNTANGALYGIENSNRGCTLSSSLSATVPPATTILAGSPELGIATGKFDTDDSEQDAVNPGGVPIFKAGEEVGGIGVTGVSADVAEYVAYTASGMIAAGGPGPQTDQIGFPPFASPGVVTINGITLPFVNQKTLPSDATAPGTFNASDFLIKPMDSLGPPPEGNLIAPTNGPLGGLTVAQVNQIINAAVATANQTRAQIRLPPDSTTKMMIAVSDLDGTLIGLFRMPDATIFSIDVAATKARNVIYFSGTTRTIADLNQVPIGTAVTNRTIGFGAQPFFPPGIDGSAPGPFFNLYTQDVSNPCTQGFQAPGPNQSGIVFFPGSEPLYINGVLVGGLGVSGDGVDQDDFVTAGGGVGFEAPASIRADQVIIDGVRLPYLSFPRNPTQ